MNNKTIIILLSIILAAVLIFGGVIISNNNHQISKLAIQISNSNDSFSNYIATKESTLNQMRSDIENMLEKQSSIISDYTFQYEKPDAETLMGLITLTITPKEYSEDTTAIFYINDKSVTLVRNSNTFTGTIPIRIDENYTASVTFNLNGENKTEAFSDKIRYCDKLFNRLDIKAWSSESRTSKGYVYNGGLTYLFQSQFGESLTSAKIVTLRNGEEIRSQNIFNQNAGESPEYEYETADSNSGAEYEIYVEAVDSYGFIYRYWVNGPEKEKIYDKNGNEIIFEQ